MVLFNNSYAAFALLMSSCQTISRYPSVFAFANSYPASCTLAVSCGHRKLARFSGGLVGVTTLRFIEPAVRFVPGLRFNFVALILFLFFGVIRYRLAS